MNKTYQIGTFIFRLEAPDILKIPDNFEKFAEDAAPEYTYRIEFADALPIVEGKLIAQRPDIAVLQTLTGEARIIGVKGNPEPYACYEELSPYEAKVTLISSRIEGMSIDPMFCSLLALERRMLSRDSLVLHTAYIVHNGKGILFSAPSQTGKSTQARLWEQYRSSRTINGDRGLLRKENGIWVADGWPVCGSSEICNVECYPIHAIVMLSQAAENSCTRLLPGQAFQQLYSQITVNRWNRKDTVKAMDLIEDMLKSVPVYHLACTISETAVECLEDKL